MIVTIVGCVFGITGMGSFSILIFGAAGVAIICTGIGGDGFVSATATGGGSEGRKVMLVLAAGVDCAWGLGLAAGDPASLEFNEIFVRDTEFVRWRTRDELGGRA